MARVIKPMAAALSVIGGMAVLGVTDNLMPFISETGSLWQFHMLRGAMAVILLAGLAVLGFGQIKAKRPRYVLARSLFPASAMLIYFGCLARMPIGVVVAGLFTSPLFVLLISVMFQRQNVGLIRWIAVTTGFVGSLMVIQPDPSDLDPIAFLPILAGVFYAIGAVLTRIWCEDESTLSLSIGFFGMLTAFGTIGLFVLPAGGPEGAAGFSQRGWVPMTGAMWFWIAVQAIGSLIGIALIFRGYLLGEAGRVAVFEYSLLVFASFWAWVMWSQEVDRVALSGMALIVVAGAVISQRAPKQEAS